MIVGGRHFDDYADAFPEGLLPQVFRLLAEQWPHFRRTTENPLENRITNRFVGYLHRAMRTMRKPFHFDYRPKLPDADADSERGEPDIKVQAGRRGDVVFTIECKRLNLPGRSNAGEYVGRVGMGCFVEEQYISNPESGGMLGYVMDNRISRAQTAINRQLAKKAADLKLMFPAELVPAPFADEVTRVMLTKHELARGSFTIYHLLLPYDDKEVVEGCEP